MSVPTLSGALVLLLTLSACTAETQSETREVAAESGQILGVFAPNPDPPGYGWNDYEVTLTDLEGTPLPGVELLVEPWMPAHGHGTPLTPEVSEQGDGVYSARVFYNMGGTWELRVELSAAGVQDRVVVEQRVR